MEFESDVIRFVELASAHEVQMLMVGGGAVNFHGYQRHSADVDFWVHTTDENLDRLERVLAEMGFSNARLPEAVRNGQQNVSIKISPIQEIELITNFNPGKTFAEAFDAAERTVVHGFPMAKFRVLNFDDLIESKLRSQRPKDLLDIQELQRKKHR
jgi:hypothetical protein